MFLDADSRRKLKEFYFNKNIPSSESLEKIKKLMREHLSYVEKCQKDHTLVRSESGEMLLKRVHGILSVTYDEDEQYDAALYFFSWCYNTLLAIYNKVNATDLQYVNEDVVEFAEKFKYLVNENENILLV